VLETACNGGRTTHEPLGGSPTEGKRAMCHHTPACPDVRTADACRAHVVADHSEQGWTRLCNGIILFDDGHYLTPDGHDELVLAAAS